MLHRDEALGGEGAEGTIVASGGDDDRCVDRVRVHARLVVVVHADQGPVRDDTRQTDVASTVGAGDKIFHCSGIEQLDIRELQDLDSTVLVKRAACLTTTKLASGPSSSYGMPSSRRNASAGLRITMALKSWPPNQAPPPGATPASMMAILRSGRAFART